LKRNIWRHSVTCADTPDTALGPRFHRLLVVVIGGQWLPSRGLSADYKMVAAYGRGDEPVFAQGASVRSAVPVATS